jgi:hypothetical protein
MEKVEGLMDEIAVLAEDYENKCRAFECQQMLNVWGKTAEERVSMSIDYHMAEARMIEAKARLDRAKLQLAASA